MKILSIDVGIKNLAYCLLDIDKDKTDFKILHIIKQINKISKKKIKVKWLSNKIIKEKIYKYNILKQWKPLNSKIQDIIDVITG